MCHIQKKWREREQRRKWKREKNYA
jgi:hypothetical protein